MAGIKDFALGAARGLLDAGSKQAEFNRDLGLVLWMEKLEQKREGAKEKAKQYRERAAERRDFLRKLTRDQYKHDLNMDEIAARNRGKSNSSKIEKIREGDEEVAYQVNPDGSMKEIGRGPAFKPAMSREEYVTDRLGELIENNHRWKREGIPEKERDRLNRELGREYDQVILGKGEGHDTGSMGKTAGIMAGSAMEAAKRTGLLSGGDQSTKGAPSTSREQGQPADKEPSHSARAAGSARASESSQPQQLDRGLIGDAVEPSEADIEQLRQSMESGNFRQAIQQFQSVYGPMQTFKVMREEFGIDPESGSGPAIGDVPGS